MNPIAIGPLIWDVLENYEWSFPNEILSAEETVQAIKFTFYTIKLFMCKICSSDAQLMLKDYKWLKKIGYQLNNNFIVTRTSLRRFYYDFHNIVNEKLKKKPFPKSFEMVVQENTQWFPNYLRYCTFLCFYYPTNNGWKKNKNGLEYHPHYAYDRKTLCFYFQNYFQNVMPFIFELVGFKSELQAAGPLTDLVWLDRNNLVRWFHQVKKNLNQSEEFNERFGKHNFSVWTISEEKSFSEACVARQDCGADTKPGTIFQGCQ